MEKPKKNENKTKKGTGKSGGGVKTMNNFSGTVLEKPKTQIKKENTKENKKEIVEKPKFPGKGTLVGGGEFEKSHEAMTNLIDIYEQLGKK